MDDFYRDRSATIEMTSRNVELLNRRNAQPEKRHSATSTAMTEFERTTNQTIEYTDKPTQILTSSPKFVKLHENGDNLILKSRGAVPRRSGSCSSSSSSSTRSSLEQGLSHSRSSPPKTNSIELSPRNENRTSLPELENIKRTSNSSSPRSKVSSPAQTENSWTKFGCSQTDILINNRLRRTSSSDSRSSSMSSTSKISTSSSSSISPRYSPIENKKASPCVSPQPGIEGLTLVQRTEIVLRVNATTSDVASQTEIIDDDDESILSKDLIKNQILPVPRRKLPEEIECEELSRDLASQLEPNDKLVDILARMQHQRECKRKRAVDPSVERARPAVKHYRHQTHALF
ncbi:hypothetical protein PV327_002911 [Microctonus hyperodae]|uniref:Uncharacterized protein n=1 Tax=Microctonus hyperodae TaxID=165561 RepID=A0AA39G398_MICHY|nr:hypothetical protein PV327_002911 [Microctonus hyperodae]